MRRPFQQHTKSCILKRRWPANGISLARSAFWDTRRDCVETQRPKPISGCHSKSLTCTARGIGLATKVWTIRSIRLSTAWGLLTRAT